MTRRASGTAGLSEQLTLSIYFMFIYVVFALYLEKSCDTFNVTATYKYSDLQPSSMLVFNTVF